MKRMSVLIATITLLLTLGVQGYSLQSNDLIGVWVSDDIRIKIDPGNQVRCIIEELSLRAAGQFQINGNRINLIMTTVSNNDRIEMALEITNFNQNRFSGTLVSLTKNGQPQNPNQNSATFNRIRR